jgi:hypothetical protein
MMRYYDWTANAEGNSIVQDFRIKGWEDEFEILWRLQEGQPLSEWDSEAVAYWAEDGPLTDLPFTVPDFDLHSPRLKALLEGLGLGSDIQYLPIRVMGEKSGREVGVYYVANFLRRIPCLDLERSIYGRYGEHPEDFEVFPEKIGQISHVWKAVLRRKEIGDARLFRVDEWDCIVVVREDVKRAMEEAGITGCWFWELEVV